MPTGINFDPDSCCHMMSPSHNGLNTSNYSVFNHRFFFHFSVTNPNHHHGSRMWSKLCEDHSDLLQHHFLGKYMCTWLALCEWNSLMTDGFPSQRASDVESVSKELIRDMSNGMMERWWLFHSPSLLSFGRWELRSMKKFIFQVWYSRGRDHSGYGLGQWEKVVHSNAFFHWLSPYPEWWYPQLWLALCERNPLITDGFPSQRASEVLTLVSTWRVSTWDYQSARLWVQLSSGPRQHHVSHIHFIVMASTCPSLLITMTS